jgi:chlorite dismutase
VAGAAITDTTLFQVLALRLDPAWRRHAAASREAEAAVFGRALTNSAAVVRTLTYSTVGLRADTDVVLVRVTDAVEELETSAADLLRAGMGCWMTVAYAFTGLIRPSRYVRKPTAQEQALISGERGAYLIVYPFTKTADWYRLSREARQGMMNEHIRVGHDFPQVRQLLAYSTGLDDQEFIVAYETGDLTAFQDLVTALRETEARRYTLRDEPILTGIHHPPDELVRMLI